MTIASFIDRDIYSVSILEDTRDVTEWLSSRDYYAVVDEHLETVGIVNLADLSDPSARNIIDCDISKPQISPEQTPTEVLKIMKRTNCDHLPVFEHNNFIGVITLSAISHRQNDL